MKIGSVNLYILFLLIGCAVPLSGMSQDQHLFSLLDESYTGVNFINTIKDSKDRNILLYSNFYGGAGVGVGDFNNDGLQDLYFAGNIVPDKLYLNQGNLMFKDVTVKAGIQHDGGWSTGVTIADVNNDGNVDVYVSRELYDDKPDLRTNLLYLNNGDGTFIESAKKFGMADSERTRHATFLDFDKDGYLDLFLLTQPPNPGGHSEFSGTTLLKPEYHLKLLRNSGRDFFVDVSKQAGVDLTGFPNGVSASDINNDGWTDLYVGNDFYAPDFLFLNNQDGTFTNIVDEAMGHISYYSMGVDIADINNDALLDIFVVDMVAEDNFRSKSNMSGMRPDRFWEVVSDGGHYQYMYNVLQLNNGNTTFSDVAQLTGMATTDWSWSNLIADFDNDGLKDTYITNGLLYDIRNTDADKNVQRFINNTKIDWIQKHPDGGGITSIFDILDLDKTVGLLPSQPLKNYAFRNKGNLEFQKTVQEWGLDQESFSNGAAYVDLDNDGDLDIVVNNINMEAFIYRNNAEGITGTNFLRIHLIDDENKSVFGSRVTLYSDGEKQIQETTNVRGIYSTSEPLVHFGLGASKKADSIIVRWPDQREILLKDIDANQTLKLSPDRSKDQVSDIHPASNSLFREDTDSFGITFKHKENDFDDYEYQVLLPHKLSQFGPALAKGDINNDGLEDVYLGGANGHSATLYIQNRQGTFTKQQNSFWQEEKIYEDVDALFTDINGDGYVELYVVSGGNEFPENDLYYKDRLYINDGAGNFSRGNVKGLRNQSGSVVRASDYDGDGDMDLFVGGRHVPRHYPRPASSMLLVNENGQLTNETDKLANEFNNLGLVTDAVWNDYDSDGNIDLTVVGEWMPITFFRNYNNTFTKNEVGGLGESTGWWFSLEQGDFDQDGDIDFIAGNLGLNYKYQTTVDKPFDIYYRDFNQDGSSDIVLGYYDEDKHYPLRGLSCSSSQIPDLKKKIQKYDVFASLEIDQIYGSANLEKSLHYQANTFASSYAENLGNGNFKLSPLPRLAQFSNINDIIVEDFDGDDKLDALAVGNLFVSEIETPRNDAGTGVLLIGDGQGNFDVVNSAVSRFFARGDAKKMILLKTTGTRKIIVANNNDKLQSFTIIDKTTE